MLCRPSAAAGDALAGRPALPAWMERFALCPSLAFQGKLSLCRNALLIRCNRLIRRKATATATAI